MLMNLHTYVASSAAGTEATFLFHSITLNLCVVKGIKEKFVWKKLISHFISPTSSLMLQFV